MTQLDLARMTNISQSTLSRAEVEAVCSWRRRTSIQVFEALSRVRPFSDDDDAVYWEMTGVRAFAKMIKAGYDAPAERSSIVEQRTAHRWIDALMAELRGSEVLAVLEALAANRNIQLPPSATIAEVAPQHHLRVLEKDEITDGHRVRVIAPAKSNSEGPIKATPRRRREA